MMGAVGQAYQAIFAEGATLDELNDTKVNGLTAARANALALVYELVELATQEAALV